MTDIIPAATILLLRDASSLEVLMIERHANTPFAGGAIVFPGGRIEKSDGASGWRDLCDGLGETPEGELAPRIAAIREAFEETGILLARKDGRMASDEIAARLGADRAAIEADDALFIEMIRDAHMRLALDALTLFARWEPSASVAHRRYHTWFFAARTPPDQQAREDGDEATEAFWTTPRAALYARDEGSRKMIYPTSRNVELLDVSDSCEAVLAFAGERTIEVVCPEIIERNGERLLAIPRHLGYPITEEDLASVFRA